MEVRVEPISPLARYVPAPFEGEGAVTSLDTPVVWSMRSPSLFWRIPGGMRSSEEPISPLARYVPAPFEGEGAVTSLDTPVVWSMRSSEGPYVTSSALRTTPAGRQASQADLASLGLESCTIT